MSNDVVFVLLRHQRGGHPNDIEFSRVVAVYRAIEDVQKRIDRIARANPQYPMVQDGPLDDDGNCRDWRIGPTEDEGFFGHRPVWFRAVETKSYGCSA